MDENQNYGYNEGNYNNQGANNGQQPYGNQQYAQNQNGYNQAPQQPQYNQAPYGAQQQYNQANFGQPVKAVVYDAVPDRNSGVSVGALVCGILGLLLFWVPGVNIGLCLAGLICAIVALVKQHGGKGLAITGLVLSIIDCILTLIFMYFFILGMMLL